jgi:hypothetical protein
MKEVTIGSEDEAKNLPMARIDSIIARRWISLFKINFTTLSVSIALLPESKTKESKSKNKSTWGQPSLTLSLFL